MRHKTMRQLGRVGERYRIVQRGRIEWLRLDQGRKKLANSVELKVARPTRSTASYLPPASVVDFLPGQCFKRCGSLARSLAGEISDSSIGVVLVSLEHSAMSS